jgi:inosine-uridine nucleoside N-ribohydrolase
MRTIILDHDAGTNPDDFITLLLLLNSPEINLPLVISGNNFPLERARFVHKIISNQGRIDIQIAAGERTGTIGFFAAEYIEDYNPVISNEYCAAIEKVLDEHADVIYLCIQGMSNLASYLKRFPHRKDTFEIIHMGMGLTGAEDWITGGTNMEADSLSAKYLYELALKKLKVVGLHTTLNDEIRIHPESELYKKLLSSSDANHQMLMSHILEFHSRRKVWPALHDPLTATVALGKDFVEFEEQKIDFNDKGEYKVGTQTTVTISKKEIKSAEFMKFCTDTI